MAAAIRACCQAIEVKRGLDKVARAKVNAQRAAQGLPPLLPWYEECAVNCSTWFHECLLQACCRCCIYDRDRAQRPPCCGKLGTDGTYPNQVIKNIFGFICGIILGFLLFAMLVYHLQMSPLVGAAISAPIGCILSLGLAFTKQVRCVILLMLPQLFTSQGRALLLAFAFLMVMAGPMQNFHTNVHVMSSSAVCGQQMTQNATKEIVDIATAPMKEILDRVRAVLAALVEFADKLRDAFVKVQKLFSEVLGGIKNMFNWLGSMVEVCNEKMGEPYMKCTRAFYDAVKDCKRKMGLLAPVCDIVTVISLVCHIARIAELLCRITESIKDFIVSTVKTRLNLAVKNIYDMFYFNIKLDYHYNMTMEQSRSYDEVQKAIKNEIEDRLSPFFVVIKWSNLLVLVMLVWAVIMALLYRRKYLTKDKFDNYYITYPFRDIDERREEMNKELALPLNWKERCRYIKPMSLRMVRSEKLKLIGGTLLFLGTLLHAGFYLLVDYGLYWLLSMLRHHGRLKTAAAAPGVVKMHVEGGGVLADMYRAMITTFDPIDNPALSVDTTPCLPNPSPPDYEAYKRIGIIFAISFLLLLMEAYGLRLRHMIAGCYFPDREKERAVWLYNRVLQRRGGFLKHMRRQMRNDYATQNAEQQVSLLTKLGATVPGFSSILKAFGMEKKYCLCCGRPGEPDDRVNFVHCDNYGCKAIYCQDCFTDINNLCTVCMKPVDYGDFSDFSEERDSSDEEQVNTKKQKKKKSKLKSNSSIKVDVENPSPPSDESDLDYSYQNKSKEDIDMLSDSENESKSPVVVGGSLIIPGPTDLKVTAQSAHSLTKDRVSMDIFDVPKRKLSENLEQNAPEDFVEEPIGLYADEWDNYYGYEEEEEYQGEDYDPLLYDYGYDDDAYYDDMYYDEEVVTTQPKQTT